MPEPDFTPRFYAVLIGIDFYFPNKLPGNLSYPSLSGCVNDINAIGASLKQKVIVERVFKLTATPSENDLNKIEEPEAAWPTKTNIATLFASVTALARTGDQVFIYYSGHGGRVKTCFTAQKGAAAFDEALVPPDVGNSTSNYLRDLELAILLQRMVDKGLFVTVVLDSCHSGGGTRGGLSGTAHNSGGLVKRGIDGPDMRPFEAEDEAALVAPREELVQVWQRLSGRTTAQATRSAVTRSAKLDSGWLPDPNGYVLLAACASNESANEYPFEGNVYSGALTHWILGALQEPIYAGLTYQMLYDRIKGQITSQFKAQTPVLQGAADRVVFGVDVNPRPADRINVLAVELNKDPIRVQLDAGVGLKVNAQVAIYPAQPTSNNPADEPRLAIARVTRIGDDGLTAWAVVTQRFGDAAIERGAQAAIIDPGDARLRSRVYLATQDSNAAQQQALNMVSRVIKSDGGGWISEGTHASADLQVAVNAQNEFVIQDATSQPIPLVPAIPIAASGSAAALRVVKRLIHLTRYKYAQRLSVAAEASTLGGKLKVELLQGRKEDVPQPFADTHFGQVQSGEYVTLRITNLLPKVANDPNANLMYINLLSLQPDWSIAQTSWANDELNPGETKLISFEMSITEGYAGGVDIFKVIATRIPQSFEYLELPALDQLTNSRGSREANAALVDWIIEQVEVKTVA